MKKKVVSALLCATMVATMFAGCGSKNDSNTSDKNTGDTSAAEGTADEADAASSNLSDDGKVLNIYCWNEEFKSRITAHYPDYQEVDAVLQKGVAFCGATPFLVKNDGYPVSGRQMDK